MLGVFWLVQGIMTLVAAFARTQGRGWQILSGILGILAGLIVLVYPIASAVTLALVGGIWLVILGDPGRGRAPASVAQGAAPGLSRLSTLRDSVRSPVQ